MGVSNGKRFIEKLIEASPLERRKFTVLGQDIYVKPATRKQMVDTIPKDGVERPDDYAGLFMIVALAEDEAGDKLFQVKDIDALRERVALQLLQQIEQGILGIITPNDKQAAEMVKADPPSASA